jgi:polyhydroxyalkanoate synthesis repressor PhaR
MIRLIKRYESRKLYDTEESRYVSLDEIATWVRTGQEVRVVDNATNNDVTSQTLTQIILDEGRKGTSFLPSELLHDLVRIGERAVSTGMEQVQHGVDKLIDRLGPVRKAREEMSSLRSRLEELESSLSELERADHAAGDPQNGRPTERKTVVRIETEGEIIK